MWLHTELEPAALKRLIRAGRIVFAGNRKLRIFGTLRCRHGKRMHRANRVFFATMQEAGEKGYRPCGHCLKSLYNQWKYGPV